MSVCLSVSQSGRSYGSLCRDISRPRRCFVVWFGAVLAVCRCRMPSSLCHCHCHCTAIPTPMPSVDSLGDRRPFRRYRRVVKTYTTICLRPSRGLRMNLRVRRVTGVSTSAILGNVCRYVGGWVISKGCRRGKSKGEIEKCEWSRAVVTRGGRAQRLRGQTFRDYFFPHWFF